jgi:anti-anti-sigma factor
MGEVLVTEAADAGSVVTLSGEWDVADERLEPLLLDQLRAGDGRLVVDMLNVSFIDSSVVRALVATHREAAERDGWIRLVYTHHVIRRVIEICGLTDVLPQFGSVEAALRGHERHGCEALAAEDGRAR